MDLKNKLLSKSNQFNFYKKNYQELTQVNDSYKKEIELLVKENESLKEDKKSLRRESKDFQNRRQKLLADFELLKRVVVGNETDLDFNYCTVCGRPSQFEPAGINKRPKARCPRCGSLERDRFSFIFFHRKLNELLDSNISVLHFAPEHKFYKFFNGKDNIDYYPVDFNPEKYERRNIKIKAQVNMENIPFEDNKFDFIYNSHVLEHVSDDIKAMGELYRVLNEDGVCMVLVPLSGEYETLEKEEYNTPELRLKYYKREDHVRFYGFDIQEKLESVGFNVEKYYSKDIESPDKTELYGLGNDYIFLCTKQ